MADLIARATEQQQRLEAASRPPPVPEKDFPPRANPHKLAPPSRSTKRLRQGKRPDPEPQEKTPRCANGYSPELIPDTITYLIQHSISTPRKTAVLPVEIADWAASVFPCETAHERSVSAFEHGGEGQEDWPYSTERPTGFFDNQLKRVCARHVIRPSNHQNQAGQHDHRSQGTVKTWNADGQASQ
ncbi:hypothetical protein C8035_v008029 [Colletotrichum spinosum]|uniref:Uncharacterized protein n=1 Tax=Colletotrichum spinosum TaxID=1347390 RepID=A0A4V6QEJ9_9PEZI|nr:hypothetical protein C8035_v008029 [Colletotrichum spinosum]